MSSSENAQKRPLEEVLDDAIKKAIKGADAKDRKIDPKQFGILVTVYGTILDLTGGESQIKLHPAFSSGGFTVAVQSVSLDGDQVSELRAALSECSNLSIETLTSGDIEIGVTVPGVFYPPRSGDE